MSTTDPKSSTTPASLPERVGRLALFGPPPLLEGEDTAAYDELLARISGAVKPADIFEEIWVRDIVDLVWEAFRLRRLKANLMTTVAHKGLRQILEPLMDWADARDLTEAWAARECAAIKRVDKLLASAGLTMDAVMAQTLSISLDDVERIDRMIATAEVRRNAILHEVDRIGQLGARSCVGPRNKPRRPDSSLSRPNQTKRKPPREHSGQDKRQRECARKHGPCRAHNWRHRGTNISALMIRPKIHSLTCAPDSSPA